MRHENCRRGSSAEWTGRSKLLPNACARVQDDSYAVLGFRLCEWPARMLPESCIVTDEQSHMH